MSRREVARDDRRLWLAVCVTAALIAVGSLAARAVRAQTPTPAAVQAAAPNVPKYNEPLFALLAPAMSRVSSRPPAETLAELDRLQPQIASSHAFVQAYALLIRGLALRLAADLPAAERAATEARTLGASSGHPYLEFDALVLLVNLATDRGNLEVAAARVAEARVIADRVGEDLMRFNVRLDQGRIARQRGRTADAAATLTEAVAIAEKLTTNVRILVQALGSRSAARLGLSDYDGSLADAERAYAAAATPGVAPDLRGSAALSLAQVLSQIGDLERGHDLYTDAIDAYTQANLLVGVSLATRQRMDVRVALDDLDGAAADGERARELFVRTGSAGQEPALLSRLSLIEARRGHADASITYMTQATAKAANAQPRVKTAVEMDLASAALQRRDFTDATTRFARVLDQARALNDRDIEWRAENGLGRSALNSGDFAVADGHFQAAVTIVERLRRTLPEAGLRADFIAERLEPYDGLIAAALARSTSPGDIWTARGFDVSERARGRALADLLAETQARPSDPAVARVRTQENDFGRRLSSLQQAIADAKTDADRQNAVADLLRAETDYDAFIVRIRRETPQYAALAHPNFATAAEIARTLPADTALVSFWVGADRGTAWAIAGGRLTSYRLPGRRDLDRDIARLRSAIAGGQTADVRRLGLALHQTLFQTLDYSQITHVVIVPDGPLWRAPFAALSTADREGAFLIQHTAVSVIPSASLRSTLVPPAGARAPQPALVFGLETVPDNVRALRVLYDERLLPAGPLPYAVTEARAVARVAAANATSVFLNERAVETAFKRSAAAPFRVVHVASHALIDDRVPRRTALVLGSTASDDGLLQLNEIANLRLDADLVVLSTCQSQLGHAVRGEGLESLSRAFIHSGARAVAATLWAVNDRQTSRLMPLFYTALKAGAPPDQALRSAQLEMIKTGGADASPLNWAGFVLMGRADRKVF